VEGLGLDCPVTCIQCHRCVSACPEEALRIADSGLIEVDEEQCTSCGTCRDVCPTGVLEFRDTPFFCTACNACVEACNLGVLELVGKGGMEPPSEEGLGSRTPAKRRALWALSKATELTWIKDDDVRIYRQDLEG
jgi:Fe-S-cluster-containing hydrogenase component 2